MSVEALHECSLKVTCFSPEPYVLSYTGMTVGQARRNLSQALKGVDPAAVEKETVAGLERARAEFAFHTADCAPSCFFDTAKGHGEYVCNCGEAFASREDWERHVVVAVIDAANEGGER